MPKTTATDTYDVLRLSPGNPVGIVSQGGHPFVLHKDLELATSSVIPETILTTDTTAADNSILVNVPNAYAYLDLWVTWTGTYTTAPNVRVFGACTPRRVNQGKRIMPFDLGVGTDTDRYWICLEDGSGNSTVTPPTAAVVTNGGLSCTAPIALHLRGATQLLISVTSAATGTALTALLMGRLYS